MALEEFGIPASPNTVARLLHQMGYALRANRKMLPTNSSLRQGYGGQASPDRDEQFRHIAELRCRFRCRGLPTASIDTKKRELVGNFKNPGRRWDRAPLPVNDHDFRSDAIGVAIPRGLYDVLANRGSVTMGVSRDTPARAVATWWRNEGGVRHAGCRELLLLADAGGSSGYRCGAWKTELQSQLADRFGLTVTVAHYPTGTSKWNPIEHRLFSEISKNWAGEPLDSYHPRPHPLHQNQNRLGGHRPPRHPRLSGGSRANSTTTQQPPHSAR